MLIRVLIVLLTLAGSMPLRVCTCGADHHHFAQAGAPDDAEEPASSADGPSARAPHGHQHDDDCPAAHPRPLVRNVTLPPVIDVPTDATAGVFVVVALPHVLGESAVDRPDPAPPPRVPLYLSLLSLRN